ncbi:MAG: tol-pal system protein YbgF [Rhodoferax sp.]|nr:tol-pal system protein YbgF [Rhodoferax sp.]MBP9059315.1 tol-pal system protein YbgF [Rhodoferax sp.]MBP9684021.1 tol-pal system protein YbgF [Rhodoferax sp.]
MATSMLFGMVATASMAGLFDDEEARRAILDLRQRVDAVRLSSEQGVSQAIERATEENASLRRSLLELQNQIETLRSEVSKVRGLNEQLVRDVAELQRRQKDIAQGVDERLRQFEPIKVIVDGREIIAEPAEKRDYDAALAIFRKGDFAEAQPAFVDFIKRYPKTAFGPSALFWLGNAQYATRDYKEAIINFRDLIARDPAHLRAPEAELSIANCLIELKDSRGARKTLEDLIKAYPQSEAAVTAKERLLRLK